VTAGEPRSPAVSVITIFFDGERFLEEALESVREQTFRDWELLLVDDGSSDRSPKIARAAAAGDPRIRCLTAPDGRNHGMSAARNLGLAAARAPLVAFLDADDVYLPGKLEHQVAALEREPRAQLVYGPTIVWHSWTGRPEDAARDRLSKLGVEPGTFVEPPAMLLRLLRREAWPPATCSILARRAAVDAVGGFEAPFTGMFEDQAFFYKFLACHPILVEGQPLDRYRQHAASCTQRSLAAGFWHPRDPSPSHEALGRWFAEYLDSEGVVDLALWAVLRRMLAPYDHPLRYRIRLAPKKLRARAAALRPRR